MPQLKEWFRKGNEMSRRQRIKHRKAVLDQKDWRESKKSSLNDPWVRPPRWRQRVKAMKMETHGHIARKYGLIAYVDEVWQKKRARK